MKEKHSRRPSSPPSSTSPTSITTRQIARMRGSAQPCEAWHCLAVMGGAAGSGDGNGADDEVALLAMTWHCRPCEPQPCLKVSVRWVESTHPCSSALACSALARSALARFRPCSPLSLIPPFLIPLCSPLSPSLHRSSPLCAPHFSPSSTVHPTVSRPPLFILPFPAPTVHHIPHPHCPYYRSPPHCSSYRSPPPTVNPTVSPSPTVHPTVSPSPTVHPTASPPPTVHPTVSPSPTVHPTVSPSPTVHPTVSSSPTVHLLFPLFTFVPSVHHPSSPHCSPFVPSVHHPSSPHCSPFVPSVHHPSSPHCSPFFPSGHSVHRSFPLLTSYSLWSLCSPFFTPAIVPSHPTPPCTGGLLSFLQGAVKRPSHPTKASLAART
ncbi:unnamed protein product [Closterium sp. NIES-53]